MDTLQDTPQRIQKLDEEIAELTRDRDRITRRISQLKSRRNELQTNYNLKKSLHVDESLTKNTFSWSAEAERVLRHTFKLEHFRTQQLAAINATLSKKDTLLLMPTGGGKTLCYQLPAVIDSGMTLVVSPLIALMEDQLINLKKVEINAISMSSATSKDVKTQGFQYMSKGIGSPIKLMYVTPEWLAKSKTFMSSLQKLHEAGKLNRIAIDEVHCCSQWGHDFRPDYKYLGLLKGMFKDVPLIGLTATATTAVLLDIQNMLDIPGCTILRAPFDRPNLEFKVIAKPDKSHDAYDKLQWLIESTHKNKSGIVYTATIKDCSEVTEALLKRGIRAKPYHADLNDETKRNAHEKWLANQVHVIVATVAFGMGIDKPDVRFVIHYSMPKSMETLYQESGRAGRDGNHSQCIVMFKLSDYMKSSGYARSKVDMKNVSSVLEYCLNFEKCRHYLIGLHFEETAMKRCGSMCDNCNQKRRVSLYDAVQACKDLHAVIQQALSGDKNLTVAKLVDAWFKPPAGIRKPEISKQQAEEIIGNLLLQQCLVEEKKYTPYAVNCYIRCGYHNLNNITFVMINHKNLDTLLTKIRDLDTEAKVGQNDSQSGSKRLRTESDSDDCGILD